MPPVVIESPESLKNYVGREVATSDWVLVAQQRIQQFADATEDFQWIHLDAERAARESPYRTTIAHGFLTLSLLSRLMADSIEVQGIRFAVNYGFNRVRFPAAVPAEARIRARFTL